MRIAALYDIHGNLPALEAVLGEIRDEKVDRVVVGGDVTLGPMPREVLDLLGELDLPVDYLRGNCDSAIQAELEGGDPSEGVPEHALEGVRWTADQFGPGAAQLFAGWPSTVRHSIPPLGEVLFCHATPRSETEIFTRQTPADGLRPIFQDLDAAVVVCGHTHMPFDRRIAGHRVVNAGSVGLPFGTPGAFWLLLGSDVEPRHTHYDLEAAAARIRATAHPQAADLAQSVVEPRSEREMLEVFGRAEVK